MMVSVQDANAQDANDAEVDGSMTPWLIGGLLMVVGVVLVGLFLWQRESDDVKLGPELNGSEADAVVVVDPIENMRGDHVDELIDRVLEVDGVATAVYSPSPVVQGIVPDAPTLSYGEDLVVLTFDEGVDADEVLERVRKVPGAGVARITVEG